MESQKDQVKYIDKNKAQSLVIKATYFAKKDNQLQMDLLKALGYENVMFQTNQGDPCLVEKIKKDTQFASFDYRIYEEIKSMKNEVRQQRAVQNLQRLLREPNNREDEENKEEDEEEEDLSMSVSFDYEQNLRDEYMFEDEHQNHPDQLEEIDIKKVYV